MDFAGGLLIEEAFHDRPHYREEHRRVDDVQFTHYLWVVVLRDTSSQLEELLDLSTLGKNFRKRQPIEVQDRKRLLDDLAGPFRGLREYYVQEPLVGVHVVAQKVSLVHKLVRLGYIQQFF